MEKFWVSMDQGLLCTPNRLKWLYGDHLKGVEAMGWQWLGWSLAQCEKAGLPVRRIHGRMGIPPVSQSLSDAIKVRLIQPSMAETRWVITMAEKYGVKNILVHPMEAQASFNELLRYQGRVWIENDVSAGVGHEVSYGLAVALAKRGVKAGVTGDVGHWGWEHGTLYDDEATMLGFIADFAFAYLGNPYDIRHDAHLPTWKDCDKASLRVEKITEETLQRYFATGLVTTIEAQVGPLEALNKSYMRRFRRKLRRTMQKLDLAASFVCAQRESNPHP